MNEFGIKCTKDRKYTGITVLNGTAWKNRLLQYAEAHPEEVKIIAINKDDSAFFHVPVN